MKDITFVILDVEYPTSGFLINIWRTEAIKYFFSYITILNKYIEPSIQRYTYLLICEKGQYTGLVKEIGSLQLVGG